MTLFDTLLTIGILVGFILIIYLKAKNKTIQEFVLEIIDIIKSMRDKND